MTPTWHRVSAALVDANSREGTISVFFDYDICNWLIGIRFEHDPNWFGVTFEAGPISLNFTYWRIYSRRTDTGSVT